MVAHVLVPIDGSELSKRALEHALTAYPDAAVTVLHVVDPVDAVYRAEASGPVEAERWVEAARESADALLADARERAAARGVDVDTEIRIGKPVREIVELADESDVDHIVVGSHGRTGAARLVLGSVAESVVRRSSVPVTVVR